MMCPERAGLSVPLTLSYTPLLFGCSGVVSFIISRNSRYSIFPSSVSNSSKLLNVVEGVGTPDFVAKSDRSVSTWGPNTPNRHLE